MAIQAFDLSHVHPSWAECLSRGLASMEPGYLSSLAQSHNWLPGPEKIFNAFGLPLSQVNYVLFGETPYPRAESANGYAFWDEAVGSLWSTEGLSKKVNRATSLRNILKMLLIAEGCLDPKNVSQPEIARVNKQDFVQTSAELFHNFLTHGFLLLNASPVLQKSSKIKDARFWYPFTKELLICLLNYRPQVKFILFGRIANTIDKLFDDAPPINRLYAEHPFNLSFVHNPKVINFFKPLHLLKKNR